LVVQADDILVRNPINVSDIIHLLTTIAEMKQAILTLQQQVSALQGSASNNESTSPITGLASVEFMGFYYENANLHNRGVTCPACVDVNLWTQNCSCPGQTLANITVLSDCSGLNNDLRPAYIAVCATVVLNRSQTGVFGGIFQLGPSSLGCVQVNPVTGSCNCSIGYDAVYMSLPTDDLFDGVYLQTRIGWCIRINPTFEELANSRFGGVFLSQDGQVCAVGNPLINNTCSCSGVDQSVSFNAFGFRSIVSPDGRNLVGGTLNICMN
jgi:hypothetical protein